MKRVTVKDLARELDVSLGTINKALTNKPGISNETREKIIQTAKEMGYKVNRVAQSLARNTIRIGIVMTEAWPEYYNYIKKGINQELDRLSDFNVQGKYYTIPGLHSSKEIITALKSCENDGINAVILCPIYDTGYLKNINELTEKGIPVVLLGSDIEEAKRLCSVRVDAYNSGRIAAEYMRWLVGEEKSVAVFIGNKDLREHKDKVNGFLDEAKNSLFRIAGVFETHDEPEVAYYMTGKLIREKSDLGGIYVATGNSVAVCKYFIEHGIEQIRVVGTDIFEEIIKYVKENVIQGVVFQDPVTQGKTAVKVIYDTLVNNLTVDENILISPQIALRNNIEAYFQHLR